MINTYIKNNSNSTKGYRVERIPLPSTCKEASGKMCHDFLKGVPSPRAFRHFPSFGFMNNGCSIFMCGVSILALLVCGSQVLKQLGLGSELQGPGVNLLFALCVLISAGHWQWVHRRKPSRKLGLFLLFCSLLLWPCIQYIVSQHEWPFPAILASWAERAQGRGSPDSFPPRPTFRPK